MTLEGESILKKKCFENILNEMCDTLFFHSKFYKNFYKNALTFFYNKIQKMYTLYTDIQELPLVTCKQNLKFAYPPPCKLYEILMSKKKSFAIL